MNTLASLYGDIAELWEGCPELQRLDPRHPTQFYLGIHLISIENPGLWREWESLESEHRVALYRAMVLAYEIQDEIRAAKTKTALEDGA